MNEDYYNGVPLYDAYNRNRLLDRYDRERFKVERERQEYQELIRQRERDLYDHFYAAEAEKEKVKELTHEDKMNMKKFSLNDIVALVDALSLSISSPEERTAFDVIVRNWRDDKIKEIK